MSTMSTTTCTILLALTLGLAVTSTCAVARTKVDLQPVPYSAFTRDTKTIRLSVDLSKIAQSIYSVKMRIPVTPGPIILAYPKWIPGLHAPLGPIDDLAGLIITANGLRLHWKRDPYKMYEFHVVIPPRVSAITVTMNILDARNTDAVLADMKWSSVLLYPIGTPVWTIRYDATLILPKGWQYATALPTRNRHLNVVHLQSSSLYKLIDSPVLMGRYLRKVDLSQSPRVTIDLFADDQRLLNTLTPKLVAAYRRLPAQEYAMFGGYHYKHYDFLVSLSNHVHVGLEHHQSSEDGNGAEYFGAASQFLAGGDLLPHEYTHSWNGKFMRPFGQVRSNYQQPRAEGMLWVYEGLTQYVGGLMTARTGLWTKREYRERLAYVAAHMQYRPGRSWRSLEDTAVASPLRGFTIDEAWSNYKRVSGAEFYDGGVLLWLDVDTKIRQLSDDRKSLNDFCKVFFDRYGHSTDTVPYTFDDIVTSLNKVQPFDWSRFLRSIVDRSGPGAKAPLSGITRGGWSLVYSSDESPYMKAMSAANNNGCSVNAMYSVGLKVRDTGAICDVLWTGPAFKAGLAPGMQIVKVNGKTFTSSRLTDAIESTKEKSSSIRLLVNNGVYKRAVRLRYRGGLRYPHLQRVQDAPDYLDQIISPMPVEGRTAADHATSLTKALASPRG